MIYIRLRDNFFPCYEGDIRVEHPEIGDQFVCPSTFALVEVSPEPVFDLNTHKIVFGGIYQKDGKWCVDQVAVELTRAEKNRRAKKPSEVERNPILKALREQIEKEMT